MILDKYFVPTRYIHDIYGVNGRELYENKIKIVLLDIDNTLVTYDDEKPTEKVNAWLEDLRANGIKIAFISNNNEKRVKLFTEGISCFCSWDSHKPSVKKYKEALDYFGAMPSEALVVGDQILTDVWSAGRLGCRSLLVDPIKDKTTLFFKSKRALEIPFKKRYFKLRKENDFRQTHK